MSSKETGKFIDIDDLEKGDIIEFVRAGGLYRHCGIYDGNYGVIHRAAEPGVGSRVAIDLRGMFAKLGIESDKAEIRRDDIRTVAGSSDVYRANIFDLVIRPRNDTLSWAEKRLGKKGYNILSKNCQHFCTEARYGIAMNMEEELYLGLRTGHSYRDGRILVNTVLLPDMQVQHFRKHGEFLLDIIWSVSEKCLPLALYIPAEIPRFLKQSKHNTTTQRSEFSRENITFDEERLKIFTSELRCLNDNCTSDLQGLAEVEDDSFPDKYAVCIGIVLGYDNFKCNKHYSTDSQSNCLSNICEEDISRALGVSVCVTPSKYSTNYITDSHSNCLSNSSTISNVLKENAICTRYLSIGDELNTLRAADAECTSLMSFDTSSTCSNMLFNYCSVNKPLNCSYTGISYGNSSAGGCVIM